MAIIFVDEDFVSVIVTGGEQSVAGWVGAGNKFDGSDSFIGEVGVPHSGSGNLLTIKVDPATFQSLVLSRITPGTQLAQWAVEFDYNWSSSGLSGQGAPVVVFTTGGQSSPVEDPNSSASSGSGHLSETSNILQTVEAFIESFSSFSIGVALNSWYQLFTLEDAVFNYTISSFILTVSSSGSDVDAPHIVTSLPQYAPPPIPSKRSLTAVIEDDAAGLFADATWLWEQISGPNSAIIHTPTTQDTDVTIDQYAIGIWKFQATATAVINGKQANLRAVATVYIEAPRAPRVESMVISNRWPGTPFLAPAVDDDGWSGPVVYVWTAVNSPAPATIVSPTSRMTEVILPELQATWKFKLTVTNGAFNGAGVVSVTNYAGVGEAIPEIQELFLTINGRELVTGVEG